jgi:hypothetical protein
VVALEGTLLNNTSISLTVIKAMIKNNSFEK